MVLSGLLSLASRVAPKLISGFGDAIKSGAEAYQRGSGFLGALKAGAKRLGVSVIDTAADELPPLGGLLSPLRERLVDTSAGAAKPAAPVVDTSKMSEAAPAGLLPSPMTPKPSTVQTMETPNPGKRSSRGRRGL
jgi:hypothetical protein